MRQIISVSEINPQDAASEFSFEVTYNTDPLNETLSGLGLRLHFDSSAINLNEVENIFQPGFLAQDLQEDVDNEDDDPNTDQFLNIAWADIVDVAWPGEGETPTSLFTASFVTEPDFLDQSTTLNLTPSATASGYELEAPSITVEPSGEAGGNIPEITTSDTVEVPENTTEIVTVESEPSEVSFSITGGEDAALLTINSETGELSFIEAQDFENPRSASGDNNYTVEVTATNDLNLTDQKTVTVAVQDVNEQPVLEESSFSILKSSAAGTVVGTVTATDPEGDDISYSLEGDTFAIDSDSGEITVADATALQETDNETLEVAVTASDGETETTANVNIQLEEAVNETEFNYDVDGDGEIGSLTDGILMIRHLFGFTGEALINGALGEQAERTNPEEIKAYLDGGQGAFFNEEGLQVTSALDVDNNGQAEPLSDGILIARLLSGVGEQELTNGAIAQDSPLGDNPVPEIANFIQSNNFIPNDIDNNITAF
ncbi:MAG: cadherin repeat domain-containing protein [Halothece sp.]